MSDDKQAPAPEELGYEPDILTLEDETGEEHMFEVVDATDVDGERYLALVAYDPDPSVHLEQDAEMVIMKVNEEDGEEVLDLVDDEEELFSVGQVFLNRLSEVYDIDLEELEKEQNSD